MSKSVMVLLVALEGWKKIKKTMTKKPLTESGLTLQPQPHKKVNADSEWERQCGRERGRENLACWRREIAVLLGARCMSVGFGGVLRKLKQTQMEESRDIRATRERDR